MAVEETIMIGIHNSKWMRGYDRYKFDFQVDCIQSYARIKLESNPKNKIGIVSMANGGDKNDIKYFDPTSDLDKILRNLHYNRINNGDLNLVGGIRSCIGIACSSTGESWLTGPDDEDEPNKNPKRMLLFTEGPSNMTIEEAEVLGKTLKRNGIAVDVFNIYNKEGWEELGKWKRSLDTLVATANNNNNSHIVHCNFCRSTHFSYIMSRFLDIFPCASREEEERRIKVEPKWKNRPAFIAALSAVGAAAARVKYDPSSSREDAEIPMIEQDPKYVDAAHAKYVKKRGNETE